MSTTDYDKKINSKPYRFFDWVYKLLIMNILTLVFVLLVFTALPAITAMNATIKYDMGETNIFKSYFSNFKYYFWKAFGIDIILLVVIGVVGFAFYFYSYAVPQDDAHKVIFQLGIAVMIILGVVLVMLSVHIPLIMITFESLTIGEIIKTSFYISFRYFVTTLILFGMFILKIIGCIAAPIWLLFGISLPTLLGIKLTAGVYYKFEQIDLEKIMHMAEEDENE